MKATKEMIKAAIIAFNNPCEGGCIDELLEQAIQAALDVMPKSEPVGFITKSSINDSCFFAGKGAALLWRNKDNDYQIPLYTQPPQPPQREPLNDEEIKKLRRSTCLPLDFCLVRSVEKAHGIGVNHD